VAGPACSLQDPLASVCQIQQFHRLQLTLEVLTTRRYLAGNLPHTEVKRIRQQHRSAIASRRIVHHLPTKRYVYTGSAKSRLVITLGGVWHIIHPVIVISMQHSAFAECSCTDGNISLHAILPKTPVCQNRIYTVGYNDNMTTRTSASLQSLSGD
jgi:hypothetical protein